MDLSYKLLASGELYFPVADLESYLLAHDQVAKLYIDRPEWVSKAI